MEECSQPTQLLDWTRWRRLPPNRFATFLPPRLPAVEVARRLQRDPETARRWGGGQKWRACACTKGRRSHSPKAFKAFRKFSSPEAATLRRLGVRAHFCGGM